MLEAGARAIPSQSNCRTGLSSSRSSLHSHDWALSPSRSCLSIVATKSDTLRPTRISVASSHRRPSRASTTWICTEMSDANDPSWRSLWPARTPRPEPSQTYPAAASHYWIRCAPRRSPSRLSCRHHPVPTTRSSSSTPPVPPRGRRVVFTRSTPTAPGREY